LRGIGRRGRPGRLVAAYGAALLAVRPVFLVQWRAAVPGAVLQLRHAAHALSLLPGGGRQTFRAALAAAGRDELDDRGRARRDADGRGRRRRLAAHSRSPGAAVDDRPGPRLFVL